MPLSLDIRQKYLADLRKTEPKTRVKVPYKGAVSYMGVYEIDLKYLIYNRHNGRLETEMATWDAEEGIKGAPYTEKVHRRIEQFILDTHLHRNKQTEDDLREKGQLLPGIVTLDGVIIDGNRRAMLLSRIGKSFFDAVILPDKYDESEEWIVKLETQYQLGEDQKLEYGPLEKYLKVKRLRKSLGVTPEEIGKLMGETKGEIERLEKIMDLMDDYLAHIQCPGLYKLLKDQEGGTKEGMFVDLYQDLTRFAGNTDAVEWVHDKDVDLLELKTIQFDHIRYGGDFSGTEKDYRKISHEGGGKKSLFSKEKMWADFSGNHRSDIDPITSGLGSLDDFMRQFPGFNSRLEAAQQRDEQWKTAVGPKIKENFGKSKERLQELVEVVEPKRLLERALSALSRIDYNTDAFVADASNVELVKEINRISWDMKRRFERNGKST